jgi:tRNA-dihydrouridine synthase B
VPEPPGLPAAGPLASPFAIGRLVLPNRVVLGPMAGVTTSSFRRLLKRHGVGLVVTEMVSVHGLVQGNRRTRDYLCFAEEERPLALQLFGEDPEAVRRAVAVAVESAGPDGDHPLPDLVDLNMGCPVRKVMKTGAGSALLADPERAVLVASAAVEEAARAGLAVTVKLRSGVSLDHPVAVGLAQRLEQDAGVAALAVHPRAAAQFYSGRADHEITAAVVRAVGIPVIASGDVTSVAAARRILDQTGAAAILVARGGLGNPWLVDDLLAGVDGGRRPLAAVRDELTTLLGLAADEMGPSRAARWGRKFLTWFLRPAGVPPARIEALRRLEGVDEVVAALACLTDDGHTSC